MFFPTTCDGVVIFPPPPLPSFLPSFLLLLLFLLLWLHPSTPPAALFRLGPLLDLYLYSFWLLPSSAPPQLSFDWNPFQTSTSIASCCFLLLPTPPQLSFDWDPLPDLYFYSFLLLPSSDHSPAALFRLGPPSGPLFL